MHRTKPRAHIWTASRIPSTHPGRRPRATTIWAPVLRKTSSKSQVLRRATRSWRSNLKSSCWKQIFRRKMKVRWWKSVFRTTQILICKTTTWFRTPLTTLALRWTIWTTFPPRSKWWSPNCKGSRMGSHPLKWTQRCRRVPIRTVPRRHRGPAQANSKSKTSKSSKSLVREDSARYFKSGKKTQANCMPWRP